MVLFLKARRGEQRPGHRYTERVGAPGHYRYRYDGAQMSLFDHDKVPEPGITISITPAQSAAIEINEPHLFGNPDGDEYERGSWLLAQAWKGRKFVIPEDKNDLWTLLDTLTQMSNAADEEYRQGTMDRGLSVSLSNLYDRISRAYYQTHDYP